MKRSRVKRAVFYAALVCGVIAGCELLALATYVIAFDELPSYGRLQAQRLALLSPAEGGSVAGPAAAAPSGGAEVPAPPPGAGHAEAQPPGGAHTEGPLWVIHPYYGFVANPGHSHAVDKFGFLGNAEQIQPADPDKVVVAVVGGSVATQLASPAYGGGLLQAELNNIPAFRNKEVIVLDLANGAFKQPQDLMVVNDIISRGGHIDILIAFDGFNEIALPEAHGNLGDRISPFYPQHWRQLAEGQLYPGQLSALARLQYVSAVRVTLAATFARPIVRHLVIANLIWRVADQQLQNAAARYRAALDQRPPTDPLSRVTDDRRAFLGPAVEYRTRRALYMDIARQWGRSSVLMNDLMAAQGGRYFHFLQPNQYVSGSKPLSAEEKKLAINPASPYRAPVEVGYPYLRAMGASLNRGGVWFEDLTGVFVQTSRQLYVDDCCHVNKDGNAILARTIAAAIAARMAEGDKAPSVALDKVDFADGVFALAELRRFAAEGADYDDGGHDPIGAAAK